jgi:hypothetical protein
MSGEVCSDELEGIHCTLANAILEMTDDVTAGRGSAAACRLRRGTEAAEA